MFFVILSLFLLTTAAVQLLQQNIYPDIGIDQYLYHEPSPNLNFDQFWNDFNKGMDKFHRGMDDLQRNINNMHRNMPRTGTSIEMTNNYYTLRLYLSGYEDKDIEVKAKQGWLMIKAKHRDQTGKDKNYLEMFTLPENVDPAGEWKYSQGVLTIYFKIRNNFQDLNVVWHSVATVSDDEPAKEHVVQQGEDQQQNNEQMYI